MQRNIQPNQIPAPVPVDSSVAIKMTIGTTMYQEKALMSRTDVWHKVKILKGAQYDKNVVLKTILHAVEPADLLPIKYQINGEDTFFFARNCGPALDKLCRSSLIIKTQDGEPLILLLTLAFASIHDIKMNIQPILLAALTKRYDPNKKVLNLEEFHKEPELDKNVYCPLSHTKLLNQTLKLAKTALASFEYLDLRHNELHNLSTLEAKSLMFVKYLDLRHNNLMNMNALSALQDVPIIKLWLDDNPLCENYSKPKQYIESAKRYCSSLIELDGVHVHTCGIPASQNSYFKEIERQQLVQQFVLHFFNLYDQPDRMTLKGLYHKNAHYSLSFSIPFSMAHKRKLVQFTASRNILNTTDPIKRNQFLYYGPDNVLIGLKKLPPSYHDKETFTYNLIYDDKICLVISVQGLFKNLHGEKEVLSFDRTFVLLAGECNEYNILNDQYSVGDPPQGITPESVQVKRSYEEFIPTCFNTNEKVDLTRELHGITTMNMEWSHSYLDEAKWNMRKALSNFVKDYKASAVPKDAFKK